MRLCESMDPFETFAYSSEPPQNAKRRKIAYKPAGLTSPNILIVDRFEWLLAKPCGTILETRSGESRETMQELVCEARTNGCTTVSHEELPDCFSTGKHAMIRCGLVRLDRSRVFPDPNTIYKEMYGTEPVPTQTALAVTLDNFVQGRIIGWW